MILEARTSEICREGGHTRGLVRVAVESWVQRQSGGRRPSSSGNPSLFSLLLLLNCSVVSDSLWPHGLQHTTLPCPLPSPGACANSCPLSRWCHPTISFSVVPFSSCLQSFPESGSLPVNRLFPSGDRHTGTSVLPMNIQNWFPIGLTVLISLQSKGL